MSRRYCIFLLIVTLLTATASAQTITGNIRATVTNDEAQPLEGVTVTINSRALIGQSRSVISNELGVCRFPSLAIGTYTVEAKLKGFDSVHMNRVEVLLGRTSEVRIVMRLGKTEEITVRGETPLIDLHGSGSSTVFKEEMLTELPSRQRMWVLMQVSPGVTTDYGDVRDTGTIAFGSNRQSNSWNIDGIDVTAPETGNIWWEANPDAIEQIQIIGIGAPAEYGNHTGAVFNVITKKGSNTLHGAAKYYFQTDALTGQNQIIPDSPFVFHRDRYVDLTGTLGGPISSDRVWFFGGFQMSRDAYTPPGVEPNNVYPNKLERYDLKATTRLKDNSDLTVFFHEDVYDGAEGYPPSPYTAESAVGHEFGRTPAWGAIFNTTIHDNLLTELSYAGWWGHSFFGSKTDSLEDPYLNYDASPLEISGGVYRPFDYVTYKHQANAKVSYFADDFLKSQHDFKFGVQFSYGSTDTIIGLGANGADTYTSLGYFYRVEQLPYHYGGTSKDLGFFVDDTVTVNDRLTLNFGLRFDHNKGSIPDYEALEVGTPSMISAANFKTTSRIIPGIHDFIRWNLLSPRLGFVWQTSKDARAAIRGSFGVYYDHNVIGNWDSPPPELPPTNAFILNPETGQYELYYQSFLTDQSYNQNIRPPRSIQYSLGYDHQIAANASVGVQYVYKDTTDLVGWQILGGVYEPFEFIDPFTGRQYILLNAIENPTIRKGNDPGDFPGSENLHYFQKYHALLLTFAKRFSDDWALNASYTYSRSYGLIPRMLSNEQFRPFYGAREGSDPNNYIHATGKLQGDRPHMFRAQCVFLGLPWNLQASATFEFSSGRAHNRQIRVNGLNQGSQTVIMQPTGSFRYSAVQQVDVSIGKRFDFGRKFQAEVEGQILNLLNSDQELQYATLLLGAADDTFFPIAWVQPRRLQVVLGLQF